MPAAGSGDALAKLPTHFQRSLPRSDWGVVRPSTTNASRTAGRCRPTRRKPSAWLTLSPGSA
jgi:hypothetical protein